MTISIQTTGEQTDPDGYVVELGPLESPGLHRGSRRYLIRHVGLRSFRVASNDRRTIDLPSEVQELRLRGLSPNCSTEQGTVRPVEGDGSEPVEVSFRVRCRLESYRYRLPTRDEWQRKGVALRPGADGSWDSRLDGMITPSAVVKRDGSYLLYYLGADGDRTTDGGPRNRALGVAVSSDGICFQRSDGPILSHQPHGNQEEGIFSAAVTEQDDGELLIVYGAMTAPNPTSESVDGAGMVTFSPDGLSAMPGSRVISPTDSQVYNHGDEIFPVAAFRDLEGRVLVYYVAKGREALWTVGVASGERPGSLREHAPVLDVRPDYLTAGGNLQWLSDTELVFPVVLNSNHSRHSVRGSDGLDNIVELRSVAAERPDDLEHVLMRYSWPAEQLILLRDDEEERWLMYTLSTVDQSIEVFSAPLRTVDPDAPAGRG